MILGGELGNSSAGTAAQAEIVLPRLAHNHINTALIPVAWDQLEPSEGRFDYSILDYWIASARKQHMQLVLLWFGSWKNAYSNYAPVCVKRGVRRFARAVSADGQPTEILSTPGEQTQQCDSRAFAALLHHFKEVDAAELPAPAERAGEYPSGGPHPYFLEIYRAAAPSLDFFSPDIYWPNFEYWIERNHVMGNPLFVPEARIDSASFNAFYTYGEAQVFGFAPFGIDTIEPLTDSAALQPAVAQTFAALADLTPELSSARAAGGTRELVLHAISPRPQQTVALGGYLFEATLSRSWPTKTLLTDDGALIIIQNGPDEFLVAGRGLTVTIHRDPDADDKIAVIAGIEKLTRSNGKWQTRRRLNGDQTNQGRQLSLPSLQTRIYRVTLYASEHNGSL
ncbi:MAG: hypothetical protein NVSMB62_26560 [Acidobacteriaceae bacterium]